MRYVLLVASLVLAHAAMADDKPTLPAKPLPILTSTQAQAATAGTADAAGNTGPSGDRAQDHNSSRSNKSSAHLHQENIVHRDIAAREAQASDVGMSRSSEQRAEAADHNHSASGDGTAGSRPAEGADYNSSRSNKTHAAHDGGAGSSGGTKAQDYNSSRSNTTTLREDDAADLDGDGRPDVVVCRAVGDEDCDDANDTADPVTRSDRRSKP